MGPSSGLSYAAGLQAQAQGQGQAQQQQQQQRRTNDPNEFPALSSPHPSAAQQAFYHHNQQQQQQQQQETGPTSASPLLHTSNANAGPIAPPLGTHSQYAQHQPPPPPPPGFDPSLHLQHDASAATGRLKTEDFPALHGGESGSGSGALAVGAGAGMGQQGMNGARLPPDGGKTIGGSAFGTIHPSLRHQQGVSGSSSPSSSSSAVNGNGNGMANGNGRTTTAVGDAGGPSLVPPPGVVGAYSHQQPPQNAQQQQQTQTALQPPSSQQTLQPQQPQPQPQQQQSPGILLLKPVHQLVSSPVDKWGLEALLTLIRTGGRDDQLGLQLGDDLMGIGLDMAAPGPLYPTFTSPWQDPDSARSTLLSSAAEEEYKIPACYNVQTPAASTKIGQFSDETLFYAFYTCPLDVLQMEVAAELYIRNWRWHKELSVWLTRDPNEATEQGPGYERGVFYYFDPNRYEKAETPKDFVCHYDRLEDRPEWLGRQGAEGAAGAQTGQAGVQPRGGQAVGPTGTTGTGTAIGGGGIPQSSLQQHPSSHQQQQQQQQQQQIAQNS